MSYEERTEIMINSIYKNIGELSELCIDNEITNAYDLMDLISNYKEVIRYLLSQNSSGGFKGLHDRILKEINYEVE